MSQTPNARSVAGRLSFRGAIAPNVLVAGIVSFFTDLSSEMIVPVLPLFLTVTLRAPATVLGAIEGIAESTASILRVFAGWFSDRVGRRKALIVAGYGLSNLSKPLLGLAGSWAQVLAVRFADRFGKGVRGAPRDALIADSTVPERRGLAFGFHRSVDTAGAAFGPLATVATLALLPENYRAVFWIAAVPGLIAIVVASLFLRDIPRPARSAELPKVGFAGVGRTFTLFTLAATLFTLGNSSDAFLILRSKQLGMPVAVIPLAYFAFNVVYAALATPAGALSDRLGRRRMLVAGYAVFALVYLGFGLARGAVGRWAPLPLFLVYGVYYALTEGVQRALIVDLVPTDLRATAFGTFSTMTGLALLPASLVAGVLWERVSPSAPFFYGAALAALAAVLLAILVRQPQRLRIAD